MSSRAKVEGSRKDTLRASHRDPSTTLGMTEFEKLCEIVAKLRAPGGCPWDREQTNESLLPATIEEAYEVVEAVKNEVHFREELGDLLLLVVMHAEIAREAGQFNIDSVIVEITDKLIRRHPHVFAVEPAVSAARRENAADTAAATDAQAVIKQWEAIKHAEKKDATHYLASLPKALPALMRAEKAQKKAARVNFDWRELSKENAKVEDVFEETKSVLTSGGMRMVAAEVSDRLC